MGTRTVPMGLFYLLILIPFPSERKILQVRLLGTGGELLPDEGRGPVYGREHLLYVGRGIPVGIAAGHAPQESQVMEDLPDPGLSDFFETFLFIIHM